MNKPLWYRILHQVHLWCGILLAIPLVLIGLSGSILTYHDGVMAQRAEPLAPIDAPAVIAAAQEAVPEMIPVMLRREGEEITVRMAPHDWQGFRDRRALTVTVDPATLEAARNDAGPGGGGFMGLMHVLHGSLMIPGIGRPVVGWLGVVMCFFGLSGIVMWWPRKGQWKDAFRFRWRSKGARFHRDLHGATGIWMWLVFVVVSFSGVYIAFPATVGAMLGSGYNPRAAMMMTIEPSFQNTEPLALPEALAMARAEIGDGAGLAMAMLPAAPDQPYRFSFALPDRAEGAPMATLAIDPWRGEIVQTHDPRSAPLADSLVAWQRPLHAGMGAGPVWQFLVFLSGLLPLLFAATGIAMWWIKRRNRLALDGQRREAMAPVAN